ncbi:Uncharacterised protein [Vibrio cholerae]|nr:Uncharacterised protein [Vibrio cholerae]
MGRHCLLVDVKRTSGLHINGNPSPAAFLSRRLGGEME